MRQVDLSAPPTGPYFLIAATAYSEQVGEKRQRPRAEAGRPFWYSLIREIILSSSQRFTHRTPAGIEAFKLLDLQLILVRILFLYYKFGSDYHIMNFLTNAMKIRLGS